MANRKIVVSGALLLIPLFSFGASAVLTGDAAAKAVTARQSLFKQIAEANTALRPGAEFNVDAALKATDTIAALAEKLPAAFEPNTTGYKQDKPGKYAANDAIWSAKADFDKLAADLVAGAKQARETLKSQGAAGARTAVSEMGKKCGACHDRFRVSL